MPRPTPHPLPIMLSIDLLPHCFPLAWEGKYAGRRHALLLEHDSMSALDHAQLQCKEKTAVCRELNLGLARQDGAASHYERFEFISITNDSALAIAIVMV